MRHEDICFRVDHCRASLALYHEIPGTEYWSPRMFDALLAKMKVVREFDQFYDPGEYARLLGEVRALIREMEQIVRQGAKLSGAPLEVFHHQGLLSHNMMIGRSDSDRFLHLNFGLTGMHRYTQQDVVQTHLCRLQRINTVLPELANFKNCRAFFSALDGVVDG